MQEGCKVDVDSYMASNGSWFIVTSTVFRNLFLEIGLLTQNQETMALRMQTIVDLFYFLIITFYFYFYFVIIFILFYFINVARSTLKINWVKV